MAIRRSRSHEGRNTRPVRIGRFRSARAGEGDGESHPPIQLVAATVHDMFGPLSIVATCAKRLEQRAGGDERGEVSALLQRQVERLRVMMEDLADYARVESGKIRLHRETVDLRELVRRVCDDYREFYRSHSLEVQLPGSPVWVRADRDKAQRILENLLTNAFKYSPKGTRVYARVRPPTELQRHAVVEVEDEGEGTPEESRSAVFEAFVRLERGKSSGQGLGLYIVNSLTEAHGGWAWVERAEAGGSRYCFALPADGA